MCYFKKISWDVIAWLTSVSAQLVASSSLLHAPNGFSAVVDVVVDASGLGLRHGDGDLQQRRPASLARTKKSAQ